MDRGRRANVKLMASLPDLVDPTVEQALGLARVGRILGVSQRGAGRSRRTPIEAQREAKLREIWHDLLQLFTVENAIRWIECPIPVLGNRRPLDVMMEDGGLDRVRDTLGRMAWGISS
jgi:putative toxin-antitoxin system antitoxin component (TIGR02293 family)